MRPLLLLTAAVAAAGTLATAPTVGAAPPRHDRSAVSQAASLRQRIVWNRTMTWHYQDEAGVRRTPTVHAERRTRSVAFLRWIDGLWSGRRIRAKRYLAQHRLPYTRDWLTAVAIVQRDWPGTAGWLRSCSQHEGGWGAWVPNTQGSGVGGWMQYASGTFDSHYGSALATARSAHLALPPPNARSWYSALGQAFAAGWARLHIDTHGPWNPAQDPYCA